MQLHCGGTTLDLTRPRILGVLNVTPDSFSDGGRFVEVDSAVLQACRLLDDGADLIDIGGESTRPGADTVAVDEELQRVMPVIEALRQRRPEALISIDTSKPEVMRAALAAGVHMVNDVRALRADGALEAVADSGAALCLMHMQGDPATMQGAPRYDDVVAEVAAFLAARVRACTAAGIARERLVLDPGFGFGKTLAHNLDLLAGLPALCASGLPVLAGLSRKRMLGAILAADRGLDRSPPPQARVAAGTAAALLAAQRGASLLRTHDVAPLRDALATWWALREHLPGPVAGR
jgi:dihydropteroate synthase